MKNNGCQALLNLAAPSAEDWVMTHLGLNYTIYAQAKDGESQTTSTLFRCARPITVATKEYTDLEPKGSQSTTDLPNRNY